MFTSASWLSRLAMSPLNQSFDLEFQLGRFCPASAIDLDDTGTLLTFLANTSSLSYVMHLSRPCHLFSLAGQAESPVTWEGCLETQMWKEEW